MIDQRWSIPESWVWTHAGTIAEVVGGGTPPSRDPANFSKEGVPWLTPADLTNYSNAYIRKGGRDLSEQGLRASAAEVMPAGTVLFTSRAPIGYCVIALNPIATNQGFKSLVLKGGISPEFVRFYLLSGKEYAESLASGTTFKELSGTRMARLAVPLPPLPEQRRIVARIEELRKRTARASEALAAIPALIDRYRKAVLAAAFRGDLTADWREENPEVEPAQALLARLDEAKRRDPRSQRSRNRRDRGKEANSDALDLPDLPDTWSWVSVERLSIRVVDGVHHKPSYVSSGVPFLTVKSLTAGPGITFEGAKFVSEDDHKRFIKRAHPEQGDILITKDGTLGVVRAVRTGRTFSIFVSLALIKLVDKSSTDYIELALQSPICQQQMVGVGSGLQHIHLVDLRRDQIPFAPAKEQVSR